jgi:phosphoserine phosphatase RsbU/P
LQGMNDKESINRLKLTTFKLNALLNITMAINENLNQEELLSRYEAILRKDLNIGKLILYKFEGTWKCILNSGTTGDVQKNIDVEKDLLQFNEITFISSSQSASLANYDIIVPVIHKSKHIAFVIIGDIDEEGEGISPTI